MVKRISVPKELVKLLDEAIKEGRISRSHLIAEVLIKHLIGHREKSRERGIYPTVLWKLQAYGRRRLRSPRRVRRKIKEKWIVKR